MRNLFLLTCFGFLVTTWPVHAEYRAFALQITDATNGQVRVVISTLDPLQYPKYHPVKPTETIVYSATWLCKGNTSDRRAICANPKT